MNKFYAACFFSIILFILVFTSFRLAAQPRSVGNLRGKAVDSLTATPLSFSGIKIFKISDWKLEKEAVANDGGDFLLELDFGRYYAQVDFMGYKSRRTPEFTVSKEHPTHDLGVIRLVRSPKTLQEVVVQAEKS